MKKCTKCLEMKPLDNFPYYKPTRCKKCISNSQMEWSILRGKSPVKKSINDNKIKLVEVIFDVSNMYYFSFYENEGYTGVSALEYMSALNRWAERNRATKGMKIWYKRKIDDQALCINYAGK